MADEESSAASLATHRESLARIPVSIPRAQSGLPIHRELPPAKTTDLSTLHHVELDVRIELGKTRLRILDVLNLARGSVVELDRLAADPVDIMVNDRLVARGEIVVIDGNLGVRIDEIVSSMNEEV